MVSGQISNSLFGPAGYSAIYLVSIGFLAKYPVFGCIFNVLYSLATRPGYQVNFISGPSFKQSQEIEQYEIC